MVATVNVESTTTIIYAGMPSPGRKMSSDVQVPRFLSAISSPCFCPKMLVATIMASPQGQSTLMGFLRIQTFVTRAHIQSVAATMSWDPLE